MTLVSCSSDPANDLLGSTGGQLTVEIHDHAAPGIVQCWITVAAVEAHRARGGWTHVSGDYPHRFDLSTLVNGQTRTLGSHRVSEGDYDRLRIHLTEAHLVLADGSEVDVPLPHGGLHHEVSMGQRCQVQNGSGASVSMDFRVHTSFHHHPDESWTCDPDIVVDGVQHHGHHG
jgi:hypothetical protein